MAKSAFQRRFDKRATELSALFVSQPEAFGRRWDQFMQGWLTEVRTRARAQREGDSDDRRLRIFEVLSQADRLAQAAGVRVQVAKSLLMLEHECAKTVAGLTDPRLYQFNEDCTTRIRNLSVKNRTRG